MVIFQIMQTLYAATTQKQVNFLLAQIFSIKIFFNFLRIDTRLINNSDVFTNSDATLPYNQCIELRRGYKIQFNFFLIWFFINPF